MQYLKNLLKNPGEKKNLCVCVVAICVLIAAPFVYNSILNSAYVSATDGFNESMRNTFFDYSNSLEVAVSTAYPKDKLRVEELSSLYGYCEGFKRQSKAKSRDYLAPGFQAQLAQVLASCTQLAQIERERGITYADLAHATALYDKQLLLTSQTIRADHARRVSQQMGSFHKD